jgi:hypothetical protein
MRTAQCPLYWGTCKVRGHCGHVRLPSVNSSSSPRGPGVPGWLYAGQLYEAYWMFGPKGSWLRVVVFFPKKNTHGSRNMRIWEERVNRNEFEANKSEKRVLTHGTWYGQAKCMYTRTHKKQRIITRTNSRYFTANSRRIHGEFTANSRFHGFVFLSVFCVFRQ